MFVLPAQSAPVYRDGSAAAGRHGTASVATNTAPGTSMHGASKLSCTKYGEREPRAVQFSVFKLFSRALWNQ